MILDLIAKVLKVEAMALVESSNVAELKKKLTYKAKGTNGSQKLIVIPAYKETENLSWLWVPRALVSRWGVKVSENPNWRLNHKTSFSVNFCLRDEQAMLVRKFLSAINTLQGLYGGVLKAENGAGKTLMAIYMASVLKLTTLVIVPVDKLMTQWKERLLQFTDLKEDDIGVIRQNKCQIDNKKVVIGMLHSLAMRDYPFVVYNSFGLLIVDELHRTPTEVLSKAVPKFNSSYIIGLSATPERRDQLSDLAFAYLGPILSESTRKTSKPKIVLLPYNGADTHHQRCSHVPMRRNCYVCNCVWEGEFSLGKYLNKLARSERRTEKLGKIIYRLYSNGNTVLALSDRIVILKNLKNYLLSQDVPKGDISLYTGQIKDPESKIILGTYGSVGLGYDNPEITALVFCTPRVDIRQPLGRCTRREESAPIIVDLADCRSSIMIRWARARLKKYKEITNDIINRAF